MSNRLYRLLFGAVLLVSLYFDLYWVVYALIALTVFEAITNLRIPRIVSQLRNGKSADAADDSLGMHFKTRTAFEAERGWRLAVAIMLVISVFVYPDQLWFFPWFLGLAIFGAGISGVCPVFLGLTWAGLK